MTTPTSLEERIATLEYAVFGRSLSSLSPHAATMALRFAFNLRRYSPYREFIMGTEYRTDVHAGTDPRFAAVDLRFDALEAKLGEILGELRRPEA
jgi:hypothetical protein